MAVKKLLDLRELDPIEQELGRITLQHRRESLEPPGEHQHADHDQQHTGNSIHCSDVALELLEEHQEAIDQEGAEQERHGESRGVRGQETDALRHLRLVGRHHQDRPERRAEAR